MKSIYKLPPKQDPPGWADTWYFGNGLLVSEFTRDTSLVFLHIPPVASRKPIESWSIALVQNPPEDIVAVVEEGQCVAGVPFVQIFGN